MTRWKISSNDLVIFRGKFSSNLWSINWARYLSVRTTEVHGGSLAPAFCFSKRAPLHKLLLITVYVKVTLLPSRGPLGCVKKGDLTGVRNFPLKANKLTLTRVEQTNADLLRCLMFIAPATCLLHTNFGRSQTRRPVLFRVNVLFWIETPEKRLQSYFFKALKVIDVVNQYCCQSRLKLRNLSNFLYVVYWFKTIRNNKRK